MINRLFDFIASEAMKSYISKKYDSGENLLSVYDMVSIVYNSHANLSQKAEFYTELLNSDINLSEQEYSHLSRMAKTNREILQYISETHENIVFVLLFETDFLGVFNTAESMRQFFITEFTEYDCNFRMHNTENNDLLAVGELNSDGEIMILESQSYLIPGDIPHSDFKGTSNGYRIETPEYIEFPENHEVKIGTPFCRGDIVRIANSTKTDEEWVVADIIDSSDISVYPSESDETEIQHYTAFDLDNV